MTVAVAPRAQGLGLGRRLLDELERARRRRGAASVMLEVRADNAAARALYERSGYDVLRPAAATTSPATSMRS